MIKIDIKDVLMKFSLLLLVLVCTLRFYIDNFTFSNFSLLLLFIAILFLVIIMVKEGKVKIRSKTLFWISVMMLIPSFFKNAYIEEHQYSNFLYYVFIIIYGLLLCYVGITKKNINYALNLFGIFAIITSIVTWFSLFYPQLYITKVVTLLPKSVQPEIILNFTKLNCKPGLTSHYSRNALFIVLGILTFLYYYIENKNKKNILVLVFLILTMFLVAKRAHLIFLILSIILTYFIFNKVSMKTIMKFIGMGLIFVVFCIIAVNFIPGVDYAFDRIFNNANDDISSGRFEMYYDAYNMYKENNYMGLGWGQYAKSTNYMHPGLHNDYLQILFETGIIGFILIIGSNILVLKKAIGYAQDEKNALSFIILAYYIFFLLYSLTGLPHFDVDTNIYYYFTLAILFYNLSLRNEERKLKI